MFGAEVTDDGKVKQSPLVFDVARPEALMKGIR